MTKKRVSLTLEKEIVDRIDQEAEREDLNRSQMVESIAESYFSRKGIDTAVVLCGGSEMKSMKIYDGKPVLEHVLNHLSKQGIKRSILLVGRNDEIEKRFGSEFKGVALEYLEDEELEGTAAALRSVEEKVETKFAVLNGHVIADVDLNDMVRVNQEEESVATIALKSVEDPSDFGVARMKGRTVLGFEEKPEEGEEPSRLINAGTYIFRPDIFDEVDSNDLEDVFKKLSDNRELSGYIYGGKWVEVDN